MKTAADIIQEQIGIKPGAKDTTPMDYGECKRCMEVFSSLQLEELKRSIQKEIENLGGSRSEYDKSECDGMRTVLKLIDKLQSPTG